MYFVPDILTVLRLLFCCSLVYVLTVCSRSEAELIYAKALAKISAKLSKVSGNCLGWVENISVHCYINSDDQSLILFCCKNINFGRETTENKAGFQQTYLTPRW